MLRLHIIYRGNWNRGDEAVNQKGTYKLALGGICLALTLVFLFGASVVPGAELTLYAISSLFIAVMIIESGIKGGVLLYLAAVILGLLIVPNKLAILPYGCLFGLYGMVKFYIEKVRHPAVQILMKIVFFGAVLAAALTAFREVLLGSIQLPNMPLVLLLAGGILMMLLYDLIYTLLIRIYRERVKREKKKEFHLSEKGDREL